jgi:hypothetical protein
MALAMAQEMNVHLNVHAPCAVARREDNGRDRCLGIRGAGSDSGSGENVKTVVHFNKAHALTSRAFGSNSLQHMAALMSSGLLTMDADAGTSWDARRQLVVKDATHLIAFGDTVSAELPEYVMFSGRKICIKTV